MSTSASAPAVTPVRVAPHPLQTRNFRLWWIGAVVSLFGDQFYLVALPWLMLQLTGSAVMLGGLLTAAALPRAVLMLIGGAVSDRFSPRKVMMATASARAILVAAVAALIWLDALQLWQLFLLSFAFGVADAFSFPAIQTFLPSLVEQDQLAAANSAAQSAFHLSSIAAPPPAALIVRTLGAAWAFLLDAFSFLFIIAALWALPDPPRAASHVARPNMWRSIVEGIKYVRADVALRSVVLLIAVLNFCMFGPMMVGLVYLAKQRFESPTAYGIWVAALSAGSLAGTLAAGWRQPRRRGLFLLAVSSAFGACTALLPWLNQLWLLAAGLLVMGVLSGFINVLIAAWIHQRVERSMLGRVSGVQMFAVFGLAPISLAVAGVVAQWNNEALFVAAGVLMLLLSGVAATHRVVRDI